MNKKTLTREWEKSCGKAENNPNSVWDKLEKLECDNLIRRPPGSFTVSEYAKKFGMSSTAARGNLDRLLRLGKVKKHQAFRLVYWTLVE